MQGKSTEAYRLTSSPIILLAFTIHALDHIPRAVHDSNVTKDMLDLGSRSKDEIVSQYSLEVLEHVQMKSSLHAESTTHHHDMKVLEQVSFRIGFL